jgi:hypothetical protein
MNTRKLLVSILMLVSILVSACTPVATLLPATTVPPTAASTAAPTPSLGEHVVAQWNISDPGAIAFGFDSVWVAGHHSYSTTRIDPVSNKVIAIVKGTGFRAEQALAVGNALWVNGQSNDTSWIDPLTNTIAQSMPKVTGEHHYMAYGFNSVWASTGNDRLDRIDPITNQIVASIELGDGIVDNNNLVFTTASAVWVDHEDEQEWIKVDPATATILSKTPYSKLISDAKAQKTIPVGKGTDFIWIPLDSGLLRINMSTGAGLTFLPLSAEQVGNYSVATSDSSVWVTGVGQIEQINVSTNQVVATYKTHDKGLAYIGIGFGSLWMMYYSTSLIQRLDIAP